MKTCLTCKEPKRDHEFHWAITGVRRRPHCKECAKVVAKEKRNRKKKEYVNLRSLEKKAHEKESELFNPVVTRRW